MRLYVVAEANYALRPINLVGMMGTVSGSTMIIDHFKCWSRRKDAAAYIKSFCLGSKYSKLSDFRIVALESK